MSDRQTLKGKIKKVDLQGKSIEEWAKDWCNNKGVLELHSWSKNWVEELLDYAGYDIYFVFKDQLFEIIDKEDLEYEDFCEMEWTGDDQYSFVASFYDGGTCLVEMITNEMGKTL